MTNLALVALSEQNTYKNKKSWKHKIRIIAKVVDVLLKFYPRKASLFSIFEAKSRFFEILGLLFDISKTKANDTFNYWLDILRDILPALQMEEVERIENNMKNCATSWQNTS